MQTYIVIPWANERSNEYRRTKNADELRTPKNSKRKKLKSPSERRCTLESLNPQRSKNANLFSFTKQESY